MRSYTKLVFLFLPLLIISCSDEERVIDNFKDSWQLLAASGSPAPAIATIRQPGSEILNQNILPDSLNISKNIKKIFSFRDQIYLVTADSNFVHILKANKLSYDTTLDFGNRTITDICFANGSTAYVCHENTDSVSVIDVVNNKIAQTVRIKVGSRPTSIAALGNQVYVTNQSDNTVSVIDTRTNAVTGTIDVPAAPTYVKADSVGLQMVVVSLGKGKISSEEKTPARLTTINVQNRAVTSSMAIYETVKDTLSPLPKGLAVTHRQFAFIPLEKTIMSVDIKRHSSLRKASDGNYNDILFNGLRQELLYIQNSANSSKIVTADPGNGAQRSNFTLPFPVQAILPL